jgi:hypothetical protein
VRQFRDVNLEHEDGHGNGENAVGKRLDAIGRQATLDG